MPSTLSAPLKLSKLEAVNTVLEAYGIDPVSSLGSTQYATKAETHLIRALMGLNLKNGLKHSTTVDEVWTPDVNGEIAISHNVVRVIPSGTFTGRDWIVQDNRLFDRENSTYVFDGEVTLITTRTVPWDDLPLSARWYATMAACVSILVSLKPGDPALNAYREALAAAAGLLDQDDSERAGPNLIDHSPRFARARGRARARRRSV